MSMLEFISICAAGFFAGYGLSAWQEDRRIDREDKRKARFDAALDRIDEGEEP